MASDNQRRRFRRPKFSNVIALIALFAVLGGSAYAGSKINGKKIKPGTVTSKALKDKTIKTKDLSDAAVNDLQGQQGPKGDTGAQGEQGPAGVLAPVTFSVDAGQNITDNTQTEVAGVNVTSGAGYVVNAKLQLFAGPGVTDVTCRLFRGATEIDRIQWNPPANNTRISAPLQAVTTSGGTEINAECEPDGGSGSASFRRLTALPIAG